VKDIGMMLYQWHRGQAPESQIGHEHFGARTTSASLPRVTVGPRRATPGPIGPQRLLRRLVQPRALRIAQPLPVLCNPAYPRDAPRAHMGLTVNVATVLFKAATRLCRDRACGWQPLH